MKPYHGAGGRYNKRFAMAVVKAKLADRKTFRFMKNAYVVADHVEGVLADMREGWYALEIGKGDRS